MTINELTNQRGDTVRGNSCYLCGTTGFYGECPTCKRNKLLERQNELLEEQVKSNSPAVSTSDDPLPWHEGNLDTVGRWVGVISALIVETWIIQTGGWPSTINGAFFELAVGVVSGWLGYMFWPGAILAILMILRSFL